ncbi:HNH endonuclease signature motif containing protein [Bacillus paranthracis]|uniref:HNH endonuclease signature motif containing protein n=1 Tax=Bacillus paranthracis TaxID=2026186 RepID=UPI0013D591E0|nr:HNH endonuclease signature motif containing protein [Bacillus paranthracis]
MKTVSSNRRKLIDFDISSTGCFVCKSHSENGRGYINFQLNHVKRNMHKFIYEECFGVVPDGLVIRHTCDNPKCINPEHLITGTPQDNSNDKVLRNRQTKGGDIKQSKLTDSDVRIIRGLLDDKSLIYIANMFNVSETTIWNIKHKKTWRHVE